MAKLPRRFTKVRVRWSFTDDQAKRRSFEGVQIYCGDDAYALLLGSKEIHDDGTGVVYIDPRQPVRRVPKSWIQYLRPVADHVAISGPEKVSGYLPVIEPLEELLEWLHGDTIRATIEPGTHKPMSMVGIVDGKDYCLTEDKEVIAVLDWFEHATLFEVLVHRPWPIADEVEPRAYEARQRRMAQEAADKAAVTLNYRIDMVLPQERILKVRYGDEGPCIDCDRFIDPTEPMVYEPIAEIHHQMVAPAHVLCAEKHGFTTVDEQA